MAKYLPKRAHVRPLARSRRHRPPPSPWRRPDRFLRTSKRTLNPSRQQRHRLLQSRARSRARQQRRRPLPRRPRPHCHRRRRRLPVSSALRTRAAALWELARQNSRRFAFATAAALASATAATTLSAPCATSAAGAKEGWKHSSGGRMQPPRRQQGARRLDRRRHHTHTDLLQRDDYYMLYRAH